MNLIKNNMINKISAQNLHNEINSSQGSFLILDVRTPVEFQESHISGAKNIELENFSGGEECLLCYDKIFVVCKGGVRADKACKKIPESILPKTFILDGGLDSWINNGFDVIKLKSCKFTVMQQVQIIIGIFVAIGSMLALTVSKTFALIPLFFGCGLTFAGFTGVCMLLKIIAKMPWNKI